MNQLQWYMLITVALYLFNLMTHLYRLGEAHGEANDLKLRDRFHVEFTVYAYWIDILCFMFMTILGFSLLFSNELRAVGAAF